MKANCKIKFLSKQESDGSKNRAELIAYGTIERTDKGYKIEYTEPDSEMGKSKSTLHIFNEKHLHLKRSGLYTSSLSIEENKEKKGSYITPFGELDLTILGKTVSAKLTDLGGKIDLSYNIFDKSGLLSENDLTMEIKILD